MSKGLPGDDAALLLRVDGPVARITLNRPGKRNCWNGEMYDLLGEAAEEIDADDSIRCVVVEGAGGNFSSGGDMGWYRQKRAEAYEQGRQFQYDYPSYRRFGELRVPIIAAIDGHCLMAGMNFATFYCDIRIASDRARFSFAIPETDGEDVGGLGNRGLYPSPYTWHMSLGNTLFLAVAGETFSAEHALRAGLVQEVVSGDELSDRAATLAARIAALPRDRIQASKEVYRRYLEFSSAPYAPLAELVERPSVSMDATRRYLERTAKYAAR